MGLGVLDKLPSEWRLMLFFSMSRFSCFYLLLTSLIFKYLWSLPASEPPLSAPLSTD